MNPHIGAGHESLELHWAPRDMVEAGKIVLEQYGKVERLTKTHAAASEEAR